LYARFLRHRLPTVLDVTSEKAESTIDEATREVAKEVLLIATSMAGSELGSVTNYEAALRGVDLACKRMEPTTMLFRRS